MPSALPVINEPALSLFLVHELLADNFAGATVLEGILQHQGVSAKQMSSWSLDQWHNYLEKQRSDCLTHIPEAEYNKLLKRLADLKKSSELLESNTDEIISRIESREAVTLLGGSKEQTVLYEFSKDQNGDINFYIINTGEGSQYNQSTETAYGSELIKTRVKPALAFKLESSKYNKERFKGFIAELLEARSQDITSDHLYAICYKFKAVLDGVESENPEKYNDYLTKKRSSASSIAGVNVFIRSIIGEVEYKKLKLAFSQNALARLKQKISSIEGGGQNPAVITYYAECIKVFAKRLDKAKKSLTKEVYAQHLKFVTEETEALKDFIASADGDIDGFGAGRASSKHELAATIMATEARFFIGHGFHVDSHYDWSSFHERQALSIAPVANDQSNEYEIKDQESVIDFITRINDSGISADAIFDVITKTLIAGTSDPKKFDLKNEDDLMRFFEGLGELHNKCLKTTGSPEQNFVAINCMLLTLRALNQVLNQDPLKQEWLSMINSLALFRIQTILSSAVSGFYNHQQVADIRRISAEIEKFPHKKQWTSTEIREITKKTCNGLLSDEERNNLPGLPLIHNNIFSKLLLKYSGLYDLARTMGSDNPDDKTSPVLKVNEKYKKLCAHLRFERAIGLLFSGDTQRVRTDFSEPVWLNMTLVMSGFFDNGTTASPPFFLTSDIYKFWFQSLFHSSRDSYDDKLIDVKRAESRSLFSNAEATPAAIPVGHAYLALQGREIIDARNPGVFPGITTLRSDPAINFGITSDSLACVEHNRTQKDKPSIRVLTEAASHESLGLVEAVNYYLDNLHLLRQKSERIKMIGTLIHPRYLLNADFDLIARKKLLEFTNSALDYFKHIKTGEEQKDITGLFVVFAVATAFSFVGDSLGLCRTLATVNNLLSEQNKYTVAGYYLIHQSRLKCFQALDVNSNPKYLFQALSSYLYLLNHQDASADTACKWDKTQWQQQIKRWLSVAANREALQGAFSKESELAVNFKKFIESTFLENNEITAYRLDETTLVLNISFNHNGEEKRANLNLITGDIVTPFGTETDLPKEFLEHPEYKKFFADKEIVSFTNVSRRLSSSPNQEYLPKYYEVITQEGTFVVSATIYTSSGRAQIFCYSRNNWVGLPTSSGLHIAKKIDDKHFILATDKQVEISGLKLNDHHEKWCSSDRKTIKIFDKRTKKLCYTVNKSRSGSSDEVINHLLNTSDTREVYTLLNAAEVKPLLGENKTSLKFVYKVEYHPLIWEVKQGLLEIGLAAVRSRLGGSQRTRKIKIELANLGLIFNYDEQRDSLITDDGWKVAPQDKRFPKNAMILSKEGENYKRVLIPKSDYAPVHGGAELFKSYQPVNCNGHIEFKLGADDATATFATLESQDIFSFLSLGFALVLENKIDQALQVFAKAGHALKSKEYSLQQILAEYNKFSQLLPENSPIAAAMKLHALLAILNAYDADLMKEFLSGGLKKQKTALAAAFTGDLASLATAALGIDITRKPEIQGLIKNLKSLYSSYLCTYRNIPAAHRLKQQDENKLLSLFNSSGIATSAMVRRQKQLNHPHPLPLEQPLISAQKLFEVAKKVMPEYVKKEDFSAVHLNKIMADLGLTVDQILKRPAVSRASSLMAKVVSYKELKFPDLDKLGILEGTSDYKLLLDYFKKLILDPNKVADKNLIAYLDKALKQYVLNTRMGIGADAFKKNPVYALCFLISLRHQSPRLFNSPYSMKGRDSLVVQRSAFHSDTYTDGQAKLKSVATDYFDIILSSSDAYIWFFGANCMATGPKRLLDKLTGQSQPAEDEVAGNPSSDADFQSSNDSVQLGYAAETISDVADFAVQESDSDSSGGESDSAATPSSKASDADPELYQKEKAKEKKRFDAFVEFWRNAEKKDQKIESLKQQDRAITAKLKTLTEQYSTLQQAIEATDPQPLKTASKQRSALPENIEELIVYFIINKNNFGNFCRLYNLSGQEGDKLRSLLIQYGNELLKQRRIKKILGLSEQDDASLEELYKLFTQKVGAKNAVELAFQFGQDGLDYWSLQRGALEDLQSRTRSNVLKQAIMGSGKTKAIAPTVLAYHAACDYLPIFVVPEQLLGINQKDLKTLLYQKFGTELYVLNFERNDCVRSEYARYTYEMLLNTKASNGVVIAAPKTLLSIKLKYYEYCLNHKDLTDDDIKTKEYLRKILQLLHNHGKMVIDEADTVLKITNPLIYRLKNQNPDIQLSRLFVKLYADLCEFKYELNGEQINVYDLISSKDTHSLNENQIKEFIKVFCQQVVIKNIIKKLNLSPDKAQISQEVLAQKIAQYLLDPNVGLADVSSSMPKYVQDKMFKIKDTLAFYRGVLTKILPVTLRRKHNEDYGVDEDSDAAIPYKGPNKPAYGHGFGTVEETMAYTIQQILLVGFSKKILDSIIDDFYNKARKEFESNLASRLLDTPSAIAFKKITGRNITDLCNSDPDRIAFLAEINAEIKEHKRVPNVVWYGIENYIFPKLEFDTQALNAYSHDLVSLVKPENVQGFTGTPWNHKTYPELRFDHAVGNLLVDAKARALIQNDSNKVVVVAHPEGCSLEQIINTYLDSPDIQAIIDIGAKLRQYSNLEVAQAILKSEQLSSAIECVLYFTGDTLYALKKGQEAPIQLAGTSWDVISKQAELGINDPSKVFAYYDKTHTVGVDLKFAPKARAKVLFNNHTCLYEALQGCLRMRGLESGQLLDLVIDEKLKDVIGEATIKDLLDFTAENQRRKLIAEQIMSVRKHMVTEALNFILNKSIFDKEIDESQISKMLELTNWVLTKNTDQLFEKFGAAEVSVQAGQVLEELYKDITDKLNIILSKHQKSADFKACLDRVAAIKDSAKKDIGKEIITSSTQQMDTQVQVAKEVKVEVQVQQELQLELEKINIKAHPKKPLNPDWINNLAITDKTELLKTIYPHIVQLDAITYRKYDFDSNIFLSRDFAHSFQQAYLEDTVFYKGAKVPTYLLVKHLPSGAPLVTIVSAEEAEFFIKSTKKADANVHNIHLQNYKGEVLADDPAYKWDQSVCNVRIMEQVNYFRGDLSSIGRLVSQDKLSWLGKDALKKLNALKEITVFRNTNATNLQWLTNKILLKLQQEPVQDYKQENFLGVIGRYYNWYIYYSLTNFNLYYLQKLHYLQVKALYIFIDVIIKTVTKIAQLYKDLCIKLFGEGTFQFSVVIIAGAIGGVLGAGLALLSIPQAIIYKFVATLTAYIISSYNLVVPTLVLYGFKWIVSQCIFTVMSVYLLVYIKQLGVFIYDNFINKNNDVGFQTGLVYTNSDQLDPEVRDCFEGEVAIADSVSDKSKPAPRLRILKPEEYSHVLKPFSFRDVMATPKRADEVIEERAKLTCVVGG